MRETSETTHHLTHLTPNLLTHLISRFHLGGAQDRCSATPLPILSHPGWRQLAGTLKASIVFLVTRCSTRIGQGVRGVVWCFLQSAISTPYKCRLWLPTRSWEVRSVGVSRRCRFSSATGPQSTLWMLTLLSTRLCRPSSGRRLPSWRGISTVTVLGSTGKPI